MNEGLTRRWGNEQSGGGGRGREEERTVLVVEGLDADGTEVVHVDVDGWVGHWKMSHSRDRDRWRMSRRDCDLFYLLQQLLLFTA